MARTSDQSNDTQQLVMCNLRSAGSKRIFIIIGSICVCFFIVLVFLLNDGFDCGEKITVNERHKRSTNGATNILHKSGSEHVQKFSIFGRKQMWRRAKRQAAIDPVEMSISEQIVRRKRLSEHLQVVKEKFERCRSLKNVKSECDKFYQEMIEVSQALNQEIQSLGEIARNFQSPETIATPNGAFNHKITEWSDSVRQPLGDFNREDRVIQNVNEFTPFPRFHEELDNSRVNTWNIDEVHSKNAQDLPKPPPAAIRAHSTSSTLRDNEKIIPLKNQNFDPSGQILSLCEQINRQGSHPDPVSNLPAPTSSGFVTNNVQPHPSFNPSFQQSPQVQQQQQFGVSQVLLRPNPVCFMPQPMTQQVQTMPIGQSVFMPQPQFVGPVAANTAANRIFLVNSNGQQFGTSSQFGTTSPSGQGFVQVVNQPIQARSEPSSPEESSFCPSSNQDQNPAKPALKPKSASQDSDTFYASFNSRSAATNETNPFNLCSDGEISCVASNQCIPSEKWCDNVVDCMDASDETSCSCSSRLNEDKICDGYLDCPLGSDEIGCFGCDKHSYSCYSNADEFQRSTLNHNAMCYSLVQKCDGNHDCLNGKDEEDCSMLIKDVGLHTTFMVPYTEGILYRNFHGRWYPVCSEPMDWAREACESELGETDELPALSFETGILPGPFISKFSNDDSQRLSAQIRFAESCVEQAGRRSVHIRVKCPEMKCGIVRRPMQNAPRLRIREANERKKRNEYLRIVGGDRSGANSWPYIVAMYKDGRFHCGATILNNFWVVSAAHCATKAQRHYYEVYAGLLRRFSYAPEVQISKVIAVIVNEGFDRNDMISDVSLLRLETPLLYNRWVRPICLPSPERVSSKLDPNWHNGPSPGTICTVVGWGALTEGGSGPDNLEEVNVPIMKSCKDSIDIEGNEICAGEKDGGHDACQGDSGGPLICQSKSNANEYYLAGIVSHGEGCARRGEPGVYTRVALYVKWINEMINSDLSVTAKPTKTTCPGFTCTWSNRCISRHDRCNAQVDCLGGEDELNCAFNPQGTARRRFGRQNAEQNQELPDGGGNSDIPRGNESPSNVLKSTTTEKIISTTTMEQAFNTTEQISPTLRPMLTNPEPNEPAVSDTKKTTTESAILKVTTPLADKIKPTHKDKFTTTTQADNIAETTTTIASDLQSSTAKHVKKTTESTTTQRIISTTTEQIPPTLRPILTTPEPDVPAIPNTDKTTTEASIFKATTTIASNIQSSTPKHEKPTKHKVTTESGPSIFDDENVGPTKRPDSRNTTIEATTEGFVIPSMNEETQIFKCKNISQTIDISLRCDGRFGDCEDGTDETNCTCRETFQGKTDFERLLCDGHIDCLDRTDEEGCSNCKPDEYECPSSKKCIPKTSRCDRFNDCDAKEDEIDCVALTDGKVVLIDADLRPTLNHKGIVCQNTRGVWTVRCVNRAEVQKNAELAGETCTLLGFSGYSAHNVLMVDANGEFKPKQPEKQHPKMILNHFNMRSLDRLGRFKRNLNMKEPINNQLSEFVGTPQQCFALSVECVPHIVIPWNNPSDPITESPLIEPDDTTTENPKLKPDKHVEPIKPIIQPDQKPTIIVPLDSNNDTKVEFITENFSAPWAASIYIDGNLACIGVLLDRYWILAERKCFDSVNLDHNVINVVLGRSRALSNIQTLTEQIIRVDCMQELKGLETGKLLHLTNSPIFNRYTLPTYIPPRIEDADSDCVAVSHGPTGGFVSVPIFKNDTKYQRKCNEFGNFDENIQCKDASEYGVAICRSEANNTYYPISLFSHESGLCLFNNATNLELLEPFYIRIQSRLNWPLCENPKNEPECSTHRCPLGECIPNERICDNKEDCHDGSDESSDLCAKNHKCAADHLRCNDGQCIPKINYCNKVFDCNDRSDEPPDCTCHKYLLLTDPTKICDGIPNCSDKTDEGSHCPCRNDSFKCSETDKCIPKQFVCDGQNDCTMGEDEQTCYGAEENVNQNGYYRVIERSAGEWQTKCFKKPAKPTKMDLEEICKQLGFTDTKNIQYELLDPENQEYPHPIKISSTNMISTTKLNENYNLTSIQKDAKFKPWNSNDHANCYQLEINCDDSN